MAEHTDVELYYLLYQEGPVRDQAFEELYARLSPRVFKYCRRVLGNQDLADDIFQETFVRFFKSTSKEREMTNVAGYILKIARRLCLSAKSSKHYGLAPLEDLQLPVTDRTYEHSQLLDMVRSAVECLPLNFREPLVLREYDGLSYAEIADVLSLSVSTVKIRIYRGKQKIRKILAPYITDVIL